MLEVDFRFGVASGYTLEEWDEALPARLSDAHYKAALRIPAPVEGEVVIIPQDNQIVYHSAMEINLSSQFLDLDGSDRSFLDFARRYGRLTPGPALAPEPVRMWRWGQERLKDLDSFLKTAKTERAKARTGEPFVLDAQLMVTLTMAKSLPSVTLRCSHLLGALQLQLVRWSLGRQVTHSCVECGNWYLVGPGAHRSHSRFCGLACKNRYHNKLKAQERALQKER